MAYKLICLDMDGTLLNSKKVISKRNKSAIKKAHDRGVKVAICTGRVFTSAKYYAHLLGIEAPVIASNGSYIREKDKDSIIYKSVLNKEDCKKILSVVKNYNFKVYFNTSDTIISTVPFPKGYTYLEMSDDLPDDMKIKLHVSPNLVEEFERVDHEILKCICIGKDSESLKKAREEIAKFDCFEIVSSLQDNFEITCRGTSKGRAVKILADYYNISKDQVICMGDGENDLSMIKYAGLGIAMGNAPDFVKDYSDYITDTNNNDGVAKAIEKFVL